MKKACIFEAPEAGRRPVLTNVGEWKECDVFGLRNRSNPVGWEDIFRDAAVVAVHASDNGALDAWQKAIEYVPSALLILFTDGAERLSEFSLVGERRYRVTHSAIELGFPDFLTNWGSTGQPNIEMLTRFKAGALSSLLHRLENLILPVRIDLEALKSTSTCEERYLTDVVTDYLFSEKGGVPSYFSPERDFEGARGLLGYVRNALRDEAGGGYAGKMIAGSVPELDESERQKWRSNPDSTKVLMNLESALNQATQPATGLTKPQVEERLAVVLKAMKDIIDLLKAAKRNSAAG